MTSINGHLDKIKEHLEEIKDAVDEGIEKKPITIGFHCSACASELLEIYLHQINKIPMGKLIKHNWFKRPKEGQKIEALANRKVGAEFPDKDLIYNLIYDIEENRDNLIYGKVGTDQIKKVHDSFLELKKLMVEKLNQVGVQIEKE